MTTITRCLIATLVVIAQSVIGCSARNQDDSVLNLSDDERHLLEVLQIDRNLRVVRLFRNEDAQLQVITRQGDETIRYSMIPDHEDSLSLHYHAPGVALPPDMVLSPDADPFESRR